MNIIVLVLIITAIVLIVTNRSKLGTLASSSINSVEFSRLSGKVAGAGKYSKTHVTGSGSGGYNGPVSVSVNSTSTVHQDFFVRDSDGVDTPVKMWGFDIPIADGQQVTVVNTAAGKRTRYAYLINESAKRGWPLYEKPSQIAIDLGLLPGALVLLVKSIIIGALVGWLLTSMLGGGIWVPGFVATLVMLAFEFMRRAKMGRALKARFAAEEQAVLGRQIP